MFEGCISAECELLGLNLQVEDHRPTRNQDLARVSATHTERSIIRPL